MFVTLNTKKPVLMPSKTTLLVDGNNTLHRTYWVANNTGNRLINSRGRDIGCLFTFLKTIKSYAEKFNTDQIYIAWDKKLEGYYGFNNFRKEMTGGAYKATRNVEKNQDIYGGMEEIVNATKLLGVKHIFPGKLEADDVISWLSSNLDGHKIIVSVDKDFIQLISPTVSLYNPIKKELMESTNIQKLLEMTPLEYLYYKAIVGDVSDNIDGLEGFGKVKGAKLAKAFVAKDEKAIAPYQERVEYNIKLVDLTQGFVQYPEESELYKTQHDSSCNLMADFDKFKHLCETLEFPSILDNFDKWKSTFNKQQTTNILTEYFKMFE